MVKMDRNVYQGDTRKALRRIKFCLDTIEGNSFANGIDWTTEITEGCLSGVTIEELIGALVAAEQVLKRLTEEPND
mgnify:CR=1 FL=1